MKDFLHAVLDTVLDAVISIDPQGIIQSVNRAAENVFGYSAVELVGQNVRVLMPEPYRGQHDTYISNYESTRAAKVIGIAGRELWALRANGSRFPIELGVSEMRVDGAPLYVGIVRDITERKRGERLTLELKAITDTVIDALVTIDATGRIQSVNPAVTRLFGYSAEELVGENVRILMPEPHRSAHDKYLADYQQSRVRGVIGIGRELIGRRKDGSTFPIELSVTETEVAGRTLFVGLLRDITARKAAEAGAQALITSLEISNQELDDFAYIASHDLKEPLRGLANNAMFLLEDFRDQLGADGLKRLERMRYLCDRMEKLINDLLYFSRLGRQELAIQRTDLNAMVDEVREMMLTTLEESAAEVVIPEPLPAVVCDGIRVKEVFRNLITNAIKYNTASIKRVEVGWLKAHGTRTDVLYVRDNGIGIDPRFHEEIFRIFRRLNVETEKTQGTGAGLTFVKKIVERHGGTIWLESEVGKGTTFFFTLQADERARAVPRSAVQLPQARTVP